MRIRSWDFGAGYVIYSLISGVIGLLVFIYVLNEMGMLRWLREVYPVLLHPDQYVTQIDNVSSEPRPALNVYFMVSDDPREKQGGGINFKSIDVKAMRRVVTKGGQAVIPTDGRHHVFLYMHGQNFHKPILDTNQAPVIVGQDGAKIRWGGSETITGDTAPNMADRGLWCRLDVGGSARTKIRFPCEADTTLTIDATKR